MLWSSCKVQSLSKSYSRTQKQREPPTTTFTLSILPTCDPTGRSSRMKQKNSCFLRLKSLEPTSLPPSAAHQNSILSSFKEMQPSLLHLFIINRRRLQSQEFHFSLFLRTSSLQGRLRVVTVQTKRTIFLHTRMACGTLPSGTHSYTIHAQKVLQYL